MLAQLRYPGTHRRHGVREADGCSDHVRGGPAGVWVLDVSMYPFALTPGSAATSAWSRTGAKRRPAAPSRSHHSAVGLVAKTSSRMGQGPLCRPRSTSASRSVRSGRAGRWCGRRGHAPVLRCRRWRSSRRRSGTRRRCPGSWGGYDRSGPKPVLTGDTGCIPRPGPTVDRRAARSRSIARGPVCSRA